MRKVTLIFLLTSLVLSLFPFVSSSTYIVDGEYHWTCLSKGEKLARYLCKFDCCITCQKDGYTAPPYKCAGSPCGCGGDNDTGDFAPPQMTITSPDNGLVSGTRAIPFFITTDEKASLYYLDSADPERGFRKFCSNCLEFDDTISFVDGQHVITLKAMDQYGNDAEQTRSFFIDSKKPRIRKTLPKSRGYTNGTFIVIYDEDNLKTAKLVYDQGQGYKEFTKNDCPKGIKQECVFYVPGLTDGPLNFSFMLEDDINGVQSKEGRVNVDTVVPKMTVNEPLSTAYDDRIFLFDIDVSEEVTIEYIDYSQSRPRWNKLCSKCDNYYNKKSFKEGTHDLVIRATDLAGNSDQKSVSFSVL